MFAPVISWWRISSCQYKKHSEGRSISMIHKQIHTHFFLSQPHLAFDTSEQLPKRLYCDAYREMRGSHYLWHEMEAGRYTSSSRNELITRVLHRGPCRHVQVQPRRSLTSERGPTKQLPQRWYKPPIVCSASRYDATINHFFIIGSCRIWPDYRSTLEHHLGWIFL